MLNCEEPNNHIFEKECFLSSTPEAKDFLSFFFFLSWLLGSPVLICVCELSSKTTQANLNQALRLENKSEPSLEFFLLTCFALQIQTTEAEFVALHAVYKLLLAPTF